MIKKKIQALNLGKLLEKYATRTYSRKQVASKTHSSSKMQSKRAKVEDIEKVEFESSKKDQKKTEDDANVVMDDGSNNSTSDGEGEDLFKENDD